MTSKPLGRKEVDGVHLVTTGEQQPTKFGRVESSS